MKLITIATAAKLLGLVADSLRRRETPDGKWTEVYGRRIRVYRIDLTPHAQRRFDEDEIRRLLAKLERGR